ncbi:MAG: gliding motility protein GldL [Bacteroidales bacterium]|nr:gliding motility protein GldL [Bacteroidales bacterium]
MTEYSKFNIVYRLQRWLDSVPGQTFLNYAYSWGASIVILGTLFKLTHLPGANIMLYLGMGTEVIVFFISAFDRPFDKTSIGKEIPTHVTDYDDNPDMDADDDIPTVEDDLQGEQVAAAPGMGGGVQGGTVIIGGFAPSAAVSGDAPQQSLPEGFEPGTMGVAGVAGVGNIPQQPAWVAQQQQVSPEMEEATSNYVDELKKLTDMLARVSEQSARLTRDSEEMENLNRTLTGICKVYEMQLKGASAQIGTIDQINEQSRRMAAQIEQLNAIYARMIEAMTVNMRVAANNGNNPEV